MAVLDNARDTIPTPALESDRPIVRVEASASAVHHAPRYVESIIQDLHRVLEHVRCPVHDSGASLTADFGAEDATTVNVVSNNCCAKLDEVVAEVLSSRPILRLVKLR